MVELGVNIDHVATIRQARATYEPDPVWAAAEAELGGADCITIHLREDRRHIQDRDVRLLRETVSVKLNLEMACLDEIVQIALATAPHQVTLVPERREEVTTEGGLNAQGNYDTVARVCDQLQQAGIAVSLFLDPDPAQIQAAARMKARAVELHTGQYALAQGAQRMEELRKLQDASKQIRAGGMALHAGHGLNYQNVRPVADIEGMHELNIGHAIVSRAVFIGLREAVREMKRAIA
jgi:pyridoxine 5-phosphate synthase